MLAARQLGRSTEKNNILYKDEDITLNVLLYYSSEVSHSTNIR